MRSPLDARFIKTQSLMKSGAMYGHDRPMGRVTYAKQTIRYVESRKQGLGHLRYLDTAPEEYELFNIRTIDIDRSIGQDAATCTITLYNTNANTQQPDGIDPEGQAGYLTPGRGVPPRNVKSVFNHVRDFDRNDDPYPTQWGYTENRYRDVLIPNTVLRTYQGYGSDNFDFYGNLYSYDDDQYVLPQSDASLYQTGVWLIDSVTFGADGTISVECRDLGKLLIEQYIYPPMIPIDRFPLYYCPAHVATGHAESIGRDVATFHSSSNDRKHGHDRAIHGHHGKDAFDSKSDSYWLSVADSSPDGHEWIEAKIHGPVNELKLHTWKGNYIAYICIEENGTWQGTKMIDTDANEDDLTGTEHGGYFYTVTSGDTLWDLAYRFYGNHELWPRIAHINSNIIKDPHWIYPGERIKIPYIKGTQTPPPGDRSGSGGGGGSAGVEDTTIVIPYVIRVTVPKSGKVIVSLPRTYKAGHIRVVLTSLPNFRDGEYRAGMRTFVARNHLADTYYPSTIGKAGYIQDWTEPIKEMCAWAGLTWPDASPNPADPVLGTSGTYADADLPSVKRALAALRKAFQNPHLTPTEKSAMKTKIAALAVRVNTLAANTTNHGVPLRVNGDFEILGAGPVVCTPGDYFLSKSFKEGIQQIVDFIGGIFYVDETGGAQFRLPNIWSSGNFIDDTSALSSLGARISELPIEFHEDANIITYSAIITDADLRSEILVIGGYPGVNSKGPVAGGYVLGYNPVTHTTSAIDFSDILAGQYRLMVVPGDATKLFYSERECQRMAELTALFILFTYRQGTLHAPCNPALQLDDQVRIFERVTNETNIHYVSALRTHQDLESGEYTMDATTHWLGDDPDKNWFINKAQLTPSVADLPAILKRVGKQPGGDNFEQPPYGTNGVD